MAKELRGRNITVNAVAPGPTATDLFLKGKPQAVIDHLAKLAPLERLGQPEDIAYAAAITAGFVAAGYADMGPPEYVDYDFAVVRF